jgi:hypothetical protein
VRTSNPTRNRVLRRIYGPWRKKVIGIWRKLHNRRLHITYTSPHIIREKFEYDEHAVGMGGGEKCLKI